MSLKMGFLGYGFLTPLACPAADGGYRLRKSLFKDLKAHGIDIIWFPELRPSETKWIAADKSVTKGTAYELVSFDHQGTKHFKEACSVYVAASL